MKKRPTPLPQGAGLLTQGLGRLLFLPPTPLHPYTPTPAPTGLGNRMIPYIPMVLIHCEFS
ncbi:hypothetical protein [Nostoc sp. UHCC 0870]|uniref:hypothetical protein n=1 Tax=Nostoc sp. UHCC 0870 TaxID=2914041 RepID=UPI0030D86E2C